MCRSKWNRIESPVSCLHPDKSDFGKSTTRRILPVCNTLTSPANKTTHERAKFSPSFGCQNTKEPLCHLGTQLLHRNKLGQQHLGVTSSTFNTEPDKKYKTFDCQK